MKIQYHISDFIDYCVEKGLSRKTYSSYEKTLVLFSKYLNDVYGIEKVEEVQREHIREYIDYVRQRGKYTVVGAEKTKAYNHPNNRRDYGKKVSDVTINNYLRNMRVFFNYLVDTCEIRKNPMDKIKLIKITRKSLGFIKDSEYRRLIESLDVSKLSEYRDYIIINLLMDTGMRIGECLLIETDDVDFKDCIILLKAENTKRKAERYVFFSKKMSIKLKQWLQFKDRYLETELFFPSNRGNAMKSTNFESNLRKYAKRIGLENIHPHMFRNNFAKRFLMNGGDIYTLSKILGHSSVTVTENAYLDLDVRDLRKQYIEHSPLANMRMI